VSLGPVFSVGGFSDQIVAKNQAVEGDQHGD
jgi:hypothetical protein